MLKDASHPQIPFSSSGCGTSPRFARPTTPGQQRIQEELAEQAGANAGFDNRMRPKRKR